MRKRKYSVVVFDLGNVLIPFDYSLFINNLNKIEKGLGENFEQAYMSNYHIHRSFERGEMTEDEFLNEMMKMVNHKIDKETFCRYFSEIFSVNEKVASLLPELKKNYTLILLSNTNSIHEKYGWENFSFLKYFDKLILSHEAGSVKPEEKIYRAVEKAANRPSGEFIFIDDIDEYVNAAKKLGWDAAQFTGYESLVNELRKRGILNGSFPDDN